MIMIVLTKVVDLLNIVRHLGGLSKRGVFRAEIGDQVVVVINDHMFVFVFIIGDQVVVLCGVDEPSMTKVSPLSSHHSRVAASKMATISG